MRAGEREPSKAAGGRWHLLPLGVLAVAIAAGFAAGLDGHLTPQSLIAHRETLRDLVGTHRLGALVLYMLVYVAVAVLAIPVSALLSAGGGFLFGWLLGGVAAAVSATLGALAFFAIARTSIGDRLLRRSAGPGDGRPGDRPALALRLAAGFREDAFSWLLLLRLLPLFPFWLTNLVAALVGVPLRTFYVATQIGVLPTAFAFAVAGAGLDGIVAAEGRAQRDCLAAGGLACDPGLTLQDLLTPEVLAALFALAFLVLMSVVGRRLSRRRAAGRALGGAAEERGRLPG